VEISKSYTKVEWREDLKKMLRRAGAEGHPGVFLFSDTQIKDEAFVEDINNILNSGEARDILITSFVTWNVTESVKQSIYWC
jgi:dynein heavy chain